MEPKYRKLTPEEEERMITPQMLADAEEIARMYSSVLKALAKY